VHYAEARGRIQDAEDLCYAPNSRIQDAEDALQVSIDEQGLMKVTHMVNLTGAETHGVNIGIHSSVIVSQRSAAANRMAVIQFMLVAEDDMGYDAD
jgi:hypothetical protein